MRAMLFAVAVAMVPANAMGFCWEPSPPYAPSGHLLHRPSPPFCLNSLGSVPCDQWEIDGYIDEVNRYIRQLNQMIEEANSFADDAARYADEVYTFAVCEAEAAKADLR